LFAAFSNTSLCPFWSRKREQPRSHHLEMQTDLSGARTLQESDE